MVVIAEISFSPPSQQEEEEQTVRGGLMMTGFEPRFHRNPFCEYRRAS